MKKSDSINHWYGFLSIGVGFAMVYLDQTALNVALPTIKRSLGANETQLFWVVNAYLLALAICSLGAGRIGDIMGLRRVFLTGLGIFLASSVGCALALTPGVLILFRVFQGIGGAVIPVVAAASIFHIFPEGKRGKPMGVIGFMASSMVLVGPIMGGLFTTYGSWRWIFWINPIIGGFSFTLVYFLLKEIDEDRDRKAKFDFKGQFLFLGFLVPLIIALMQGENWGWGSSLVILLLSVGLIFLPLFVWFEKKSKNPLFDFKLLKNRNFSISCVLMFCLQFSFLASVFVALYLIRSLGKTPFMAGLCLMPIAILSGLTNLIAGHLTDKIGYRKQIQIGLCGSIIAFTLMSVTAHTMNYFWLFIALCINGVSMPLAFMPGYSMIIHSTPKHQQGMASGMASTLRQVGASISMSVLGVIIIVFQKQSYKGVSDALKYATGFSSAMACVAIILACALVASIWVSKREVSYTTAE